MSDSWNFRSGGLWTELGSIAATSFTTDITASGTANTKGAWVQLGASTTQYHSKTVCICLGGNSTIGAGKFLLDIGVGTTGNEVVIYPNLICGATATELDRFYYFFPANIPAGTQISARCQNSIGGNVIAASMMFGHLGMFSEQFGGHVLALGAQTASSRGTQLDASGNDVGKRPYTEIIASTTLPIKALIIGQSNEITSSTNTGWVDFAIGAAAAEKIIIPDWHITEQSSQDVKYPNTTQYPISVDIPTGTRISGRAAGSSGQGLGVRIILYAIS